MDKITAENAETQMPQFVKFYKGIELVPEDEWKHLLDSLFTNLPFSLRIAERSRKINNVYEGRPGTLSEAEVLRDFLKNTVLPQVAGVTIDDKPFEIKPVSWYPKQMAWTGNVPYRTLLNNPDLKPLRSFVVQEEKNFSLYKQDLTSMIPTMLVDIQQQFKILEMSSGYGFHTAQILEQLYSNSKKLPDGVVVSNMDLGRENPAVRLSQGASVFYPRTPPETFPDLYTTIEKTPASRITYDRIFLKAPACDDGLIRASHTCKLRTGWTVNKAHTNHASARKSLRRGLELLKIKGQLVYFTYSMNPIENEAVIASVLEEAEGSVQLVNVRNRIPDFFIRPGMTSWKVMSPGFVLYDTFDDSPAWFQKENSKSLWPAENIDTYSMDMCLRVMPHDNDTQALFAAVFTKTKEVPWLKEPEVEEVKTEEEAKMDTSEVDASGDAKKEEKKEEKCPYNLPIRCDVNVCVSEIEWTTEVVDKDLNSVVEVENSNFKMPSIRIASSCIPKEMKKAIRANAGFKDVEPDNETWQYVKNLLDLKRFDAVPHMLQNVHPKDDSITFYCYCSPLLKSIIKCNSEVAKKSKFAGGLVLAKSVEGEHPEINEFGLLCLLPYMNKRQVNVPKEDMITVLQSKEVVFTKFTPRTQALLKAMDPGPLYFLYDPKGKNPDPKCTVYAKREKFALFVKDASTGREHISCHNLRLFGINPRVTEDDSTGLDDMETD